MKTAFENIKDERESAMKRLEGLVETSKKRSLTAIEKTDFEQIEKEINNLDDQHNAVKRLVAKGSNENGVKSFYIGAKAVQKAGPFQHFVESNYDVPEDLQGVDFFDVIQVIGGGKKKAGDKVDRAVTHCKSGLTGSALIPEYLSAQIWDGLISRSWLMKLGMQSFAMDTETHSFARINTYPSFEWKAATSNTSELTGTFDSVPFVAKTFRGWISAGQELIQDAPNFSSAMRKMFLDSLANGLDTAGCYGSGEGAEPEGIVNYSGISSYELDNHLDSWDPFIQMQRAIYENNGPKANGAILSTDAWSQIVGAKDLQENYLKPPPEFDGFILGQTSKSVQTLGTSGNQSRVIMGDFTALKLGLRLQAEIIVTPINADTYSNAILGVLRADMHADNNSNFGVITKVHHRITT
jgi:HK97 family phage major capsid protein